MSKREIEVLRICICLLNEKYIFTLGKWNTYTKYKQTLGSQKSFLYFFRIQKLAILMSSIFTKNWNLLN